MSAAPPPAPQPEPDIEAELLNLWAPLFPEGVPAEAFPVLIRLTLDYIAIRSRWSA